MSIAVPGLTKHGRLTARLNIRNGSHSVAWSSNGTYAGLIAPAARGPLFGVADADDKFLGEARSVRAGMEMIERAANA